MQTPKIQDLSWTQKKTLQKKLTTSKAEAILVQRAKKSFEWFFWYLTGNRLADHQKAWLSAFESGHDHINIISPREAGKTEFLTYYLTWYAGNHPLKTNLISSVSFGQSKDRLSMAKETIEHNPRYHRIFPHIHIDYRRTNNQTEFTIWSSEFGDYKSYRALVSQKGDLKNPTFFAAGSGSSAIIGKRISGVCLLDDPHDEQNSATEEAREKVDTWFHRTVLNCLQPGAIAAVISTRWAETDLSGRLRDRTDMSGQPIWYTIDIPAWEEDVKSGNFISYWPGLWPVKRLEAKRDEIGEILFQLMYLNNPRGMSMGHFTMEMLSHGIPDPLPEDLELIITTDLAFTAERRSDYTVALAVARDFAEPYNLYFLDMVRFKKPYNKTLDEVSNFCDRVYNNYGDIHKVLFEDQAMTISAFEEFKKKRPGLRCQRIPLKGRDKLFRAEGLIIKAQRGGLFINQTMEGVLALKSEYLGIGGSEAHDDTIDAGSLSTEYWGIEGPDDGGLVWINLSGEEDNESSDLLVL